MRKLLGFDGPAPHAIIFWQRDGQHQSKTICYTVEEEQAALDRLHTTGDFYNSYDKAVVVYENKPAVEYVHLQDRKGA